MVGSAFERQLKLLGTEHLTDDAAFWSTTYRFDTMEIQAYGFLLLATCSSSILRGILCLSIRGSQPLAIDLRHWPQTWRRAFHSHCDCSSGLTADAETLLCPASALDLWGERWDQRGQLGNQVGDVYRGYQPYFVLVDAPALVCQYMPWHDDSPRPRDVWMSCLEGIRDFTSRFANNLDQAFYGALEDGIFQVLVEVYSNDELLRLARCLQHVP